MPGSLYILMKREGTISILGQGRAGALRAASIWSQCGDRTGSSLGLGEGVLTTSRTFFPASPFLAANTDNHTRPFFSLFKSFYC